MRKHVSVTWGGTDDNPFVDLQVSYANSMRFESVLGQITDQAELIWPKDRRSVRLQPREREGKAMLTERGQFYELKFKNPNNPEGMTRADLEKILKSLAGRLGWQITTVSPAVRPAQRRALTTRSALAIEPPPPAQRQQPAVSTPVSKPAPVVAPKPERQARPARSAKVGKPREVLVGRVKEQGWLSLSLTFVRPTKQDPEVVRKALADVNPKLQAVRKPSTITIEAQERHQRHDPQLLNVALAKLAENLQWSVKDGTPQSWS